MSRVHRWTSRLLREGTTAVVLSRLPLTRSSLASPSGDHHRQSAPSTRKLGDHSGNGDPANPKRPAVSTLSPRTGKHPQGSTGNDAMLPYSVVFFVGWTVLLALWMLLDLPLGPGAGQRLLLPTPRG